MKKRKVMVGVKKTRILFEIPIWPRISFGVHLANGEKPKYRFMLYLTKNTIYGDALTWWTFVDVL